MKLKALFLGIVLFGCTNNHQDIKSMPDKPDFIDIKHSEIKAL